MPNLVGPSPSVTGTHPRAARDQGYSGANGRARSREFSPLSAGTPCRLAAAAHFYNVRDLNPRYCRNSDGTRFGPVAVSLCNHVSTLMPDSNASIAALVEKHQQALLKDWLAAQKRDGRSRDAGTDAAAADLARQFLEQLRRGAAGGQFDDITGPDWAAMREVLEDFSRSRATQGFTPSETAVFVFSLKEPLFDMLRREVGADADQLAGEIWTSTALLDRLGLYTIECYARRAARRSSDASSRRLLELSTPVVQALGRHPRAAADRHARQRADAGRHGEPAGAHRRLRRRDRHHRHHRRADRRHPGRAASAQDGRGRPADGRRLHHQRHPAADRPDDRPSRRGART